MTGSDDGVVRLNADRATWRKVEDELVVLDLESSAYLSINGTGAVLWARLEQGATKKDLTDALIAEFEVDNATATRDVEAFVADLDRRGLLLIR